MTLVTCAVYVQKTYTNQVWSIVYLLLGFVRTSCTVNEWLHTFYIVTVKRRGQVDTKS